MITISYVIPCFNAGNYLLDSVQSVLDQQGDFELIEVIIVDDHSTDSQTLTALDLLKQNPLVRVLTNTRKKGPAGARNTGIDCVRGEWIAFHDADDLVVPDGLSARVEALKFFPDAVWIGADITDIRFDGSGDGVGRIAANIDFYKSLAVAYDKKEPVRLQKPLGIFIEQAPTNMIVPLIRVEAVRSIGGFDEAIHGQEDLHFYFRLALRFDFVFVPKIVSAYRKHNNNITMSRVRTLRWEVAALEDLYGKKDFTTYKPLMKKRLYRVLMATHYAERADCDFKRSAKTALKAWQLSLLNTTPIKCFVASVLRRS